MTQADPAELFRSTAPYYARYRPAYPAELFGLVADRFGLDGRQPVLDIGCGTGQLALPLSRSARTVVAVDPEPAMLAEGRAAARAAGVGNVDWRLGDSTGLVALGTGPVHLASFGASFHWTDREATLAVLDGLVGPGGGVLVASGGAPTTAEPPGWQRACAEVRHRWLGPERRAGSGTYRHPRLRHEEVLAGSPFPVLETARWTRMLVRTLDEVVGLQFSFSYSAPALLGPRRPAYEADLRAALRAAEPSGRYVEEVRTEAILATRAVSRPGR